MANAYVYEGSFKNDRFDSPKAKLYLPNMLIYIGKFTAGKTHSVAMLKYPNGEIYYGQLRVFERNGFGKLIYIDGSFYEGSWESDKM